MAKKSPSRTSGPGSLDEEDAALWERIARTAEPLKKGSDRALPRAEEALPSQEAGPATTVPPKPRDRKPAPSQPTAPPQPPPLGSFDRREAKGLGGGRISIGARIDLHGMRQREAHAALRAFLHRAQAEGHRHVLVITGKGSPRGASEAESFYEEPGETPGVLRRSVPQWLTEPALRAIVVSYTQASPRHGGEGALYVRLRKAGK